MSRALFFLKEKSVSRRYCVIQNLNGFCDFFFRSFLLYNMGFVLVLCIKIVIAFSLFLHFFCLIIAISVYLKIENEEVSVVIYVQKSMKSAFVWNSIVFVICSYFLNCISTVFCFFFFLN